MKFCENCGAKIKDGEKFCENCGCEVVYEEEVVEVKEASGNIAFCENCGAKLVPGSSFCESCGAKVSGVVRNTVSNKKDSGDEFLSQRKWLSVFNMDNIACWNDSWIAENSKGMDTGLMICDTDYLCADGGFSREDFYNAVEEFVTVAYKRHKVKYYLVDKNWNSSFGQEAENAPITYVEILQLICTCSFPKYLFILGNKSSVNKSYWYNPCSDNEKDPLVYSDLCYSSVTTDSPFEGTQYNPDSFLQVGRLVNIPGIPFTQTLHDYTTRIQRDIDNVKSYGVTAAPWEDTSRYVYGRFKTDSNYSYNSPNLVLENIGTTISGDENLIYFNVHGSGTDEYWYGQDRSGYPFPPVSSPDFFDSFTQPFILGVEACYGAKYEDNDGVSDSTVYSAFNGNCVSMLGSSCIAYGTGAGPGSCADIMIGRFLQDMKEGYTAGQSYVNAVKELLNSDNGINDSVLKTLAEFALYGDPSYRRSANVNKSKMTLSKAFGISHKSFHVPLPDTKKICELMLCEVDAKIAEPISKYVGEKYKGFDASVPSFYESINSKLKQACYTKDTDFGTSYLKVYFDDKGKIVKELISK